MTHLNAKYTPEHRAFIASLWGEGLSASDIVHRLKQQFRLVVSRSAICALASRMKLKHREDNGDGSRRTTAKRLATMVAKGTITGRKPKMLAAEAPGTSEEPTALGIDTGCQWLKGDDPKAWVFCGHPKFGVTPYCQHHFRRCYAPSHKPMVGSSRVDRQFR